MFKKNYMKYFNIKKIINALILKNKKRLLLTYTKRYKFNNNI